MFERFTDGARRVVAVASDESRLLGHDYIGTEHLLLGLVRVGDGVAGEVLASSGVELEAARAAVEQLVGRGEGPRKGQVPFTPRAKKVLELSLREALALGDHNIRSEHLLLGLLHDGESVSCQTLEALGVAPGAVEAQLRTRLSAGVPPAAVAAVRGLGPRRWFRLPRRPGQPVASEQPDPFDQELLVIRRLTTDARRVMLLAQSEALRLGRPNVGEQHMLLGLAAEGEGGGARALAAVGVTLEAARAQAPPSEGGGRPHYAALLPAAMDVLEMALVEAVNRGRQEIDTEDILLGLVHRADDGEGDASALFAALGTTADAVRAAVFGLSEG